MTKWQADSTALFGRMVDHSTGLRGGAWAYVGSDSDNAADLDTAGSQLPPDIDV